MATLFDAEQMAKIRRDAGVKDVALEEHRETFAVATTEVPAPTKTQPVSVGEIDQRRHAVALDLAAVRAQIAAMDDTVTPVERTPGIKNAQVLDVVELRGRIDRIDQEEDVRAAGLEGMLERIRRFFTRKRT